MNLIKSFQPRKQTHLLRLAPPSLLLFFPSFSFPSRLLRWTPPSPTVLSSHLFLRDLSFTSYHLFPNDPCWDCVQLTRLCFHPPSLSFFFQPEYLIFFFCTQPHRFFLFCIIYLAFSLLSFFSPPSFLIYSSSRSLYFLEKGHLKTLLAGADGSSGPLMMGKNTNVPTWAAHTHTNTLGASEDGGLRSRLLRMKFPPADKLASGFKAHELKYIVLSFNDTTLI